MKVKNPPKKLKLIKTTIAHLNVEQMNSAQGGNTTTLTTKSLLIMCTDSNIIDDETSGCPQEPYPYADNV